MDPHRLVQSERRESSEQTLLSTEASPNKQPIEIRVDQIDESDSSIKLGKSAFSSALSPKRQYITAKVDYEKGDVGDLLKID